MGMCVSCRYSGPGSFLMHVSQSLRSWLFVRCSLVNWPVPVRGPEGEGSLAKPVGKSNRRGHGKAEREKEVWQMLVAVCLFSRVGIGGGAGRKKAEENSL